MNVSFKAMTSRASWEWRTPRLFYEALNREFRFDYDPCPIDGDRDGAARLLTPWTGKRVFCNPPYGPELVKFLERWRDPQLAVYLLPARTDTAWFHEVVLPHAKEIRFIRGRLTYNDGKGRAPFPSMVVVFEG